MFLLMLLLNVCHASEFDTAKASIMYVQPALNQGEAFFITKSLLKHAKEFKLDWKVMASIISQESSFKKDPQDCLHKKFCADLGIAQINWKTWNKELHLDRNKLLTDVDYNILIMCQILSRLKDDYGDERHWFTRYHSFKEERRQLYADYIYHIFLKITAYSLGYEAKKGLYVSAR